MSVFDVASKSMYWLVMGFTISLLLISFVFLISGYKDKLTHVPAEVRSDFISLRFANNPDCFAFQDELTGNVIIGSIDLAKFTQERLDDCYKTPEELGHREINFRLQLKNTLAAQIATNNYYNVDHFSLRKDVLVWDGSKFSKDELMIYVQETLPRKTARAWEAVDTARVQSRQSPKDIERGTPNAKPSFKT
ncbi:hypothetical protein HYV86_05930 [Candidatus Woesearchaeota archaeon]|nr:hypothetical protein [Candidatus Woesearchaeota archaeon]